MHLVPLSSVLNEYRFSECRILIKGANKIFLIIFTFFVRFGIKLLEEICPKLCLGLVIFMKIDRVKATFYTGAVNKFLPILSSLVSD